MDLLNRTIPIVALVALALSGSAQFGPPQELELSTPNDGLHLIDMDGDEHPDLVGLFFGNVIKWSRNADGLGAFDQPDPIVITYSDPLFYSVADLQSDGLPDIVYVKEDYSVRTVRNLGNGSFGPSQFVGQLPDAPGAMACSDINGNGFPELVFSLPEGTFGAGFGWFPNTGTGFLPMITVGDVVAGPASPILLIGDLDQVGGNDVILQHGDGSITVQRNMSGTGMDWETAPVLAFPAHPYLMPQLLDVDADGDLDLAEAGAQVVHWGENRVGEGGTWLPFIDHTLDTNGDAGLGSFGHLGCGLGVSVLYQGGNDQDPMRWRTFLPVMDDMAFAADLPDLENGSVVLIGDIDGDERNDLVMQRPAGLFWHRNLVDEPTTQLEMPALDTLCVFGPPVMLPSMEPNGGRWSGNWVIDGLLHRANIGATGNYPIAHTVYEPGGCPVAGISPIQLLSGPVVTPDLSGPLCSGVGPIQLETTPMDVTWSGIGPDGILDPATYAGGSFACSWTDVSGIECATVMGPVFIWPTVPVEIAAAGPFCVTDAVQAIAASIIPPQGGTWSGAISGTVGNVALFDPSIGAGAYEITLHVEPTGPQQCANDDTLSVVVSDDIPVVTIDPIDVYCANGSAIFLSGATPAGGIWGGTAIQGGVLEPSLAGTGTHAVSYTYEAPSGCSATAQTTIELVDQVLLSWDADDLILCGSDLPVQFNASPTGGSWGSPIDEMGVFDPADLDEGTYLVNYEWNGPNGCTLINPPGSVIVQPTTEVLIEPVATLCDDDAPVQLIGNIAGNWSGAVSGEGNMVWFDPSLTGPGTWTVQLEATEAGSCTGMAAVEIVVEFCTGLSDHTAPKNAWLAPNPFAGMTRIQLVGIGMAHIEVLDATGRMVRSTSTPVNNATTLSLDLGDEPNGAYLVRIRFEDQVFHLRAIRSDRAR